MSLQNNNYKVHYSTNSRYNRMCVHLPDTFIQSEDMNYYKY